MAAVVLLVVAAPHAADQVPDPAAADRTALLALYNATGGASWTNNTGWTSRQPLGQWHGVTTDAEGRVTELELAFNKLSGTIPAELGRLANLESLYFYNNELSGVIPAELGNLTNLRRLYLAGNSGLTGCLPNGLWRVSSDAHDLIFCP